MEGDIQAEGCKERCPTDKTYNKSLQKLVYKIWQKKLAWLRFSKLYKVGVYRGKFLSLFEKTKLLPLVVDKYIFDYKSIRSKLSALINSYIHCYGKYCCEHCRLFFS